MIRPFAGPLLRSRGPSTLRLGERGGIEIIGRASRKMAANRKLQVEAEWDVVNCFSQTESIKSTVSRLIADVTARSIVLGFLTDQKRRSRVQTNSTATLSNGGEHRFMTLSS